MDNVDLVPVVLPGGRKSPLYVSKADQNSLHRSANVAGLFGTILPVAGSAPINELRPRANIDVAVTTLRPDGSTEVLKRADGVPIKDVSNTLNQLLSNKAVNVTEEPTVPLAAIRQADTGLTPAAVAEKQADNSQAALANTALLTDLLAKLLAGQMSAPVAVPAIPAAPQPQSENTPQVVLPQALRVNGTVPINNVVTPVPVKSGNEVVYDTLAIPGLSSVPRLPKIKVLFEADDQHFRHTAYYNWILFSDNANDALADLILVADCRNDYPFWAPPKLDSVLKVSFETDRGTVTFQCLSLNISFSFGCFHIDYLVNAERS